MKSSIFICATFCVYQSVFGQILSNGLGNFGNSFSTGNVAGNSVVSNNININSLSNNGANLGSSNLSNFAKNTISNSLAKGNVIGNSVVSNNIGIGNLGASSIGASNIGASSIGASNLAFNGNTASNIASSIGSSLSSNTIAGNFPGNKGFVSGNAGIGSLGTAVSGLSQANIGEVVEVSVGNTGYHGEMPIIGYVTFEGYVPADGIVSVANNNCECTGK